MASRAVNPYRNRSSVKDPRHLVRFLKSEGGMTPEEIARAEGVSAKTVRESITQIQIFRGQNSTAQMDFAMRDIVVSAAPRVKETLHGLLTATEMVEVRDAKTGNVKVKVVEDKTTRLEAVKVFNTIAQTMQPKTPATSVNVQQNTQIANISDSTETTEERFRKLAAKAAAQSALPPEVAGVPEHIDAGEDADDGDDEDDDDEDDED